MSGGSFEGSTSFFLLNVGFEIVGNATNEPHPSWVNRLRDILEQLNQSQEHPSPEQTVEIFLTPEPNQHKMLFGYNRQNRENQQVHTVSVILNTQQTAIISNAMEHLNNRPV